MKFKIFDDLSTISIGTLSLSSILSAVLIFIICFIVIKIILRLIGKGLSKTKLEKGMSGFIQTALKIGLWFLAIATVAGALGIPTASLVAVLSVAGLALSLSVQSIMANIFSGLTILVAKPFVCDDYIELGGVAGTVTRISLFYTTVTTMDNKVIYIPNSEITASKVTNYTHEPLRRVDLTFCAAYSCPTDAVKAALADAASAVPKALASPAPTIGILSYKSSSIEYALRVWCDHDDYFDVLFGLNAAVRESFERHGIEMTFDHVNVHILDR